MQVLTSARAQYMQELVRRNLSIRVIEVRHHTFLQSKRDGNVELGAFDTMRTTKGSLRLLQEALSSRY